MSALSPLPYPPKQGVFSAAQRRVLESIHTGGNLSSKNRFLQRACEFYLDPLGLRFELAEYDFFSIWEAECFPSFRGLSFDLNLALKENVYSSLFLPFRKIPPLVRLEVKPTLPFPEFLIDLSKIDEADLWAVKDIEDFREMLGANPADLINNEIRTGMIILKKTLDAGFLMLFDPFEGEGHSKAFLFDPDDFFDRAKDQLLLEE